MLKSQNSRLKEANRTGCRLLTWMLISGLLLVASFPIEAQIKPFINDAPRFSGDLRFTKDGPVQPRIATNLFTLDTSSREQVRLFYQTVYQASIGVPVGWNGSISNCNPGTSSRASQEAAILRVNFFRAMAGVPAWITLDESHTAQAQAAAELFSANNSISHFPPTNWVCWSKDAADAAKNSNIDYGLTGADSIDGYMIDGASNNAVVGHRRWLLYPWSQRMATGNVPASGSAYSANATWVFDTANWTGARPTTRTNFVSWPPPGFIPYSLVPGRWSFSYPGADLSGTTVAVSSNGIPISASLETYSSGVGENTVVWVPSGLSTEDYYLGPFPKPAADTEFGVTVSNVLVGGISSSFAYTVTVFDPSIPAVEAALPVISGSPTPVIGVTNTYTFSGVPGATGYELNEVTLQPFGRTENGASDLVDFTTNGVSGFSVLDAYLGAPTFYLAHNSSSRDPSLTLATPLLVNRDSELSFDSVLGAADLDEAADVEVSSDAGIGWTSIYSDLGNGDLGENLFTHVRLSLAAFSGRVVLVRFHFGFTRTGFISWYPPAVDTGWRFTGIRVSDALEITSSRVTDLGTATSFAVSPASAKPIGFQVSPLVFGKYPGGRGPIFVVNPASTSVGLTSISLLSSGRVQISAKIVGYTPSLAFRLESAAAVNGPWAEVPSSTFSPIVSNSTFSVTTRVSPTIPEVYFRLGVR